MGFQKVQTVIIVQFSHSWSQNHQTFYYKNVVLKQLFEFQKYILPLTALRSLTWIKRIHFLVEIKNFLFPFSNKFFINESPLNFRLNISFYSKIESFIVEIPCSSLFFYELLQIFFVVHIIFEGDNLRGIVFSQNNLRLLEVL